MYQDKSLMGLILGSMFSIFGSIMLSITRSDVLFAMTLIASTATTIAALVKARKDWKDGNLKPFWNNWKAKKGCKGKY